MLILNCVLTQVQYFSHFSEPWAVRKIKEPVIHGNPFPTSFPLEPHSMNGWTIPLIYLESWWKTEPHYFLLSPSRDFGASVWTAESGKSGAQPQFVSYQR
ncbi:hypothetical protein BDV41DRAFT_553612 [Aspergillus transmontanensis]|uniref:Uncharacterized protein n=1 Tax=Aspergillus transmontanensis TaxID=1034304 RepID=A0A5N6VKW0_9EURO|nr:hypothetical protein BDV41DRAFT_553612 [Aspergillus transmontanensis]